jgi:hypothetical protein
VINHIFKEVGQALLNICIAVNRLEDNPNHRILQLLTGVIHDGMFSHIRRQERWNWIISFLYSYINGTDCPSLS